MESIRLRSHIGADGLLQLEIPTHLINMEVEVTVMVKSVRLNAEDLDLLANQKPKKTIEEISEEFRQLRDSIKSDTLSIREMIEEGRRF